MHWGVVSIGVCFGSYALVIAPLRNNVFLIYADNMIYDSLHSSKFKSVFILTYSFVYRDSPLLLVNSPSSRRVLNRFCL